MVMASPASNTANGSLYHSRMRCRDCIGKRHIYRVGLDCVERRQRGRMRIIAAAVGLGKGGEAWMRGVVVFMSRCNVQIGPTARFWGSWKKNLGC
jgi:hypothetical protein